MIRKFENNITCKIVYVSFITYFLFGKIFKVQPFGSYYREKSGLKQGEMSFFDETS